MLKRRSGVLVTATLLCSAAIARDPRPGEPDYVDIAPPVSTASVGATRAGSSPFNPPEESDTTFVVDSGGGLDTGCTFRSGGPLRFEVLVDRAFSAADIDRLKQSGKISDRAVLRMPAYDIDFDGGGSSYAPERDRVYFNDRPVPEEFLTGGNGIWKLNTFQVPIEWVRFREPGAGIAEPGRNEVRIDIDTANSEEVWCTAIDWAALSFEAVRPVVMAHGILSDNSVWRDVWVPSLQAAGVPVSDDINPSMGMLDSIQNNAAKIGSAVAEAKDRWGVDKVNLVTHSKGGLDSRHYAEGADDIGTLVQLGTPNAGSPLADLVQGIVLGGGGLGTSIVVNALAGPAGVQLTTPYMAFYNRFHGYNPEVGYNALAGVYDPQCIFCRDAWLNEIVGEGDTIVPIESVHALPYTRNFRFDSAGPNRDAAHTVLEKSFTVYRQISSLVTNPSAQRQNVTIGAEAGQHSETAVGTISSGQMQSRVVVVDEPSTTVSMLYPSGVLGLQLVSPSGRRIDPAVAGADVDIDFVADDIPGGRQAGYALRNAELGTWTVEVSGVEGSEIDYAVSSWVQGARVRLDGGFAEPAIATGETLTLQATLREQGIPLLDATVHALVSTPAGSMVGVLLRDDGTLGDAVASDGVYSGLQGPVAQPGLHRVLFIAEGADGLGRRFSRETFGLASVSDGNVEVTGFSDVAHDTNGNGYFDELEVRAQVTVDAPGQYRVLAVLVDSAGRAHQISRSQTLAAGANTVSLRFNGRDLYRNRTDGPFSLTSLRMAQEGDIDLMPVLDTDPGYSTAAYNYRSFEHDRIGLVGTGAAFGVDSNGNGLFDSIDIAVDVELEQAGYYSWSAQLSDPTGTRLGFYSGAAYLEAGRASLLFNFPGEPIGKNGEDGPYFVTDLLAFGGGASLVANQAYAAQPFLASQFEGYVRDRTPPVLRLAADPAQLWPPNHRLVPVTVKVGVEDDHDPQPVVTLVSVQSNEADNGLGDGDTSHDVQGADVGTDDRDLLLRAERSGSGVGRVYTLTYQARDAAGNVATETVTVEVPLSRN